MSESELLAWCLILVAAGNETTRNAISGGLLAFLDHPDEWRRLRREPALLPRAVEEVLRWTSPVVQMARTASEDVLIGGRRIRAGDVLVMFYASANRDETVFDEVRPQLEEALDIAVRDGVDDTYELQRIIRRTIGRWVSNRLRRRPMIIPVVIEA